jgi:hypothetical protein
MSNWNMQSDIGDETANRASLTPFHALRTSKTICRSMGRISAFAPAEYVVRVCSSRSTISTTRPLKITGVSVLTAGDSAGSVMQSQASG